MPLFPRKAQPLALVALVVVLTAQAGFAQRDAWHTIEIQTTEVTAPDMAIAPNGEWLVFSMLGHLFQLSVDGGDAAQLTFGPYYDARPTVSPDSRRIAFQSDRDGSEGNIFMLDLATGEITQVTHDTWADAPSWSSDGQFLVYLQRQWQGWNTPATVWRVGIGGDATEQLRTEAGDVHSPFVLSEGRVGWAVTGRDSETRTTTTRIELRAPDGSVSVVHTVEGMVGAVVPTENGFIIRRQTSNGEYLARLTSGDASERRIVSVADERGVPGFAVSPSGQTLYVADLGKLWKIPEAGRTRERISFHATVAMEVRPRTSPPTWTAPVPGAARPPRGILYPRLSPDGNLLIFVAARRLWEQPLDGGAPRALTDVPIAQPAVSPNGRRVAFAVVRPDLSFYCSQVGGELRVIDRDTGNITRLADGNRGPDYAPTWTRDGRRILVWQSVDRTEGLNSRPLPPCSRFNLMAFGLNGSVDTLVTGVGLPGMFTTASLDGHWLFYVARTEGSSPFVPGPGAVFRLSLDDPTKPPESITRLDLALGIGIEGTTFGRVSSDGRFFAYRRPGRREISIAPLGGDEITREDVRLVTPVGGASGWTFTDDGTALTYSTPSGVWRHPLNGDAPIRLPIGLELTRPASPPPVLLRRVRVLDWEAGEFSAETSLMIVDGRIMSVGPAEVRALPPDTRTLDAGGRFAIPGLFDVHAHSGTAPGDPGRAYLSYGITSLRSPGGLVHHAAQLADREFLGAPSARWFYTGDILNGAGGSGIHNQTVDDVRAEVRLQQEWGVSFIKAYTDLPWPLHRAVSEEARRLDLPVLRHGNNSVDEVVKGVTEGGLLTHVAVAYEDVLGLLAAVQMQTDPTLSGVWGIDVRGMLYPEYFRAPTSLSPRGEFVEDDRALGIWSRRLEAVRRAYRMGISLLAGTDWVYPWSLHMELEMLTDAGIPPLDVLRAATLNAAEAVGARSELGTLEPGKLADLVILDGNPLEDIRNTQAIWRVIKDGTVFDPAELRSAGN